MSVGGRGFVTTAATGEKRHWRRRYRHRFDVGITADVFRCSFDATFPPFWHCLVVWKDVVFRHTSGVVCSAVPGTLQALFAASLRRHTRRRLQYHFKHTSGAIPGTVYNTISGALQVPFKHHTRCHLQHHSRHHSGSIPNAIKKMAPLKCHCEPLSRNQNNDIPTLFVLADV